MKVVNTTVAVDHHHQHHYHNTHADGNRWSGNFYFRLYRQTEVKKIPTLRVLSAQYLNKNSSGDEIANVLVNDDIAHT